MFHGTSFRMVAPANQTRIPHETRDSIIGSFVRKDRTPYKRRQCVLVMFTITKRVAGAATATASGISARTDPADVYQTSEVGVRCYSSSKRAERPLLGEGKLFSNVRDEAHTRRGGPTERMTHVGAPGGYQRPLALGITGAGQHANIGSLESLNSRERCRTYRLGGSGDRRKILSDNGFSRRQRG